MSWPTEDEINEIKKYVLRREDKDIVQLKNDSKQWIRTSWANKLSYEITWLGIPIIQTPDDIVILQELIFKLKPDVIIESGIAHGGSLIFYASLLELMGKGKVIGIDIEIRPHNRAAIEKHALSKKITLIEGNSINNETIEKVKEKIEPKSSVLVCLDSNHTKEHVLAELNAYNGFVTKGSYIIVFDTIMPDLVGLPEAKNNWDRDNPMEAIKDFLAINRNFEIDYTYNKLFVSHCPNGFLKRK